jgi:glycosyltransferase involved in cell wall biosynthesis
MGNSSGRIISVLMFDAAYPLPVIGGKEKQAYLLANELVKDDSVDVGALTFEFSSNHNDRKTDLDVVRVKKGKAYLINLASHLIKLRKRYNILHIHTPSRVGKFVAIIGKFLSYKIFYKIPNEDVVATMGINKYIDQFFFRFIITKAIILEKSTWKELIKYNYLESKLIHIPNGVEVRRQKKYLFKGDCINILFVGRLVQQKGCDKLIQSVVLLAEKGIKFKVKIAGDGPELLSLKKMATELGVNKQISFIGNKDDVISYMYKSDVLVLTSNKEGMSNVILEAMSIGLPIIATKAGAIKLQIGDYYYKYSCNIDTAIIEVSNKIEDLYRNNSELKVYGDYLYKRSKKRFSIIKVSKEYLEAYKVVSHI